MRCLEETISKGKKEEIVNKVISLLAENELTICDAREVLHEVGCKITKKTSKLSVGVALDIFQ